MRECISQSDINLFQSIYFSCFKPNERLSVRKLKREYQILLHQNDVIVVLKKLGSISHIEYLGVNPSSQGQGYGKKILQMFSKATLECKEHLIPFYVKMGFHVLKQNKSYYFLYKGISHDEANEQLNLLLMLNLITQNCLVAEHKKLAELIWFLILQTYFIFLFRDVSA